jgi:hypothetical protein
MRSAHSTTCGGKHVPDDSLATSQMGSDSDTQDGDVPSHDLSVDMLRELVGQAQQQTRHLADMHAGSELDLCLLDKIARIVCLTANESHLQTLQLTSLTEGFTAFLEIYKSVHPEQTLQFERLEKMRAELRRCCPPQEKPELICTYEPCQPQGGIAVGDGYSAKSRSFVNAVQVGEEHAAWTIQPGTLNDNEIMPKVPQGPLVGQLVPSVSTPHLLDFRSGPGPSGGGEAPVTFRTFTHGAETNTLWPPDMSGAKAGDVVVMSGNLWLKLSVDGGKTFSDLDFTKLFAADTTYGGWAGDQVVHYVPSIDCFVLYVQSYAGSGANASKNVVKIAIASPADLKKYAGGKQAWRRQWHFTSDTFGLNLWLDFPDMSYGDAFLYVNTNVFQRTFDSKGNSVDTFQGKLFFEVSLKEMQAGGGLNVQYGFINEFITFSSPAQNITDENYWAAHVDNATMRIFSSKGTDANYYWRERKLKANWPTASKTKTVNPEDNEDNIVSAAPDSPDWISEDHRIVGVTRRASEIWFAWTAAKGDGGAGGFTFPQPHIQIAKFDLTQDYKFIEQTQVWNADNAFAYPSLTTNSDFEVGISVAWGGGKYYGSHAVGILGDFVLWYGEASGMTSNVLSPKPTRFGDFLHVRLAEPDKQFFSAFGYAVTKDTSTVPPTEKPEYLYVEFGREPIAPSPIH